MALLCLLLVVLVLAVAAAVVLVLAAGVCLVVVCGLVVDVVPVDTADADIAAVVGFLPSFLRTNFWISLYGIFLWTLGGLRIA